MRFLFYRYNNICEEDMLLALGALGHETDTIELEMYNKNPSAKEILMVLDGALSKGLYDGVISVNFYPIISKICNAFKVRYISWTTDCPVDELYTADIKNDLNRTFCFDYAQYEKAYALNQNRVFYMPLAANVERFDKAISEFESKLKGENTWESEVSFVGSLYTEKQGQDWFEKSARDRLEVLSCLGSEFQVDVYTGSDTKGLQVNNKGRVKTHTQMPLVFHYSKINLNVTCASITTGLPQRIWDVLACGGFLITNNQPEISEYFIPGTDLETYSSMEELRDKVNYYLTHEKERCEIAQNGYDKVKKEHTFISRMNDILYIAFAI